MKWFVRLCVVVVMVGGGALYALEHYLHDPVAITPVDVVVPSGASLAAVAADLEAAGVIRYADVFRLHVRLKGDDRGIKAGEYRFEGELTPYGVYEKLLKGQYRAFEMTLLEGWTLEQYASHLARQEWIELPEFKQEFLAATRDPQRIAKLGVEASTLEGFLFPDTYRVHEPKSAGELVDVMMREFQERYDDDIVQRAEALGMSMLEVVTLASIIEKETGAHAERELVSSVFHNRLKKGMKLETDPTIIYGLENFDGNIRKKDIRNPHPYNTYVHHGLPPGPIANPGEAALRAAVNPAESDYFFFVSRNNGTHKFSKTYREHVNAVNEFQRRRRK